MTELGPRGTSLVFVDGMIGAGKSTTAQRIAAELEAQGRPAAFVAEGDERLRVARRLAHGFTPWDELSTDEYIARCRAGWHAYLVEARGTITVCDGLLFHGNLTDLLLMEGDATTIARYFDSMLEDLRTVAPTLIYLRTSDVATALRAAADARGPEWVKYQIGWKLTSPHARSRHLTGWDGLVSLYEEFREICDAFVATRRLPTLSLGDDEPWTERERKIHAWLALTGG